MSPSSYWEGSGASQSYWEETQSILGGVWGFPFILGGVPVRTGRGQGTRFILGGVPIHTRRVLGDPIRTGRVPSPYPEGSGGSHSYWEGSQSILGGVWGILLILG